MYTSHKQDWMLMSHLLLDTHDSYCFSLQRLKLSCRKSGLQMRHDAVSIFEQPLAFLLQHGDARAAAQALLLNA